MLARRFLLVQQVTEPLKELGEVLTLVGENQEPEPLCFAGLLYKQFVRGWRSHVHLPFLEPLSGGGSLGSGRFVRCGSPRCPGLIFSGDGGKIKTLRDGGEP